MPVYACWWFVEMSMWRIRGLFPVVIIVIVVAWLWFRLGGFLWFAGAHTVHVAIEVLTRWTFLDVSLCKRFKWQNDWEKMKCSILWRRRRNALQFRLLKSTHVFVFWPKLVRDIERTGFQLDFRMLFRTLYQMRLDSAFHDYMTFIIRTNHRITITWQLAHCALISRKRNRLKEEEAIQLQEMCAKTGKLSDACNCSTHSKLTDIWAKYLHKTRQCAVPIGRTPILKKRNR